ncbi:glycosyl hydrolase family 28-related protein [Glaciecola siphonariae]|uniref:Glycosyl hydrolase family 28-related protein n=1 Tax=Glaciecola siphonariae TaxID=521012 RepID=A0ABV9LX51_9ALTE
MHTFSLSKVASVFATASALTFCLTSPVFAADTTTIAGANGNNVVTGTASDDRLNGTSADDSLNGLAGNDYLRGRAGNDEVYGGDGNDHVGGDEGDDHLFGGPGNDALWGDGGSDRLSAGEGDDKLYVDADDLFINGGAGRDTLFVRDARGVSVDMSVSQLELAYGDVGDDTFDASLLNIETILHGGAGNDLLYGGKLKDRIDGGDGNDTLVGNAGNDILRGRAGADTVYGSDGNDHVGGDEGDDILFGGAGDDSLWGDEGVDKFDGGAGNDRLYVDADDISIDGGEGYDKVIFTKDGSLSLSLGDSNIESVDASDRADVLDASSSGVSVRILAKHGDDIIIGSDSDDKLYGSEGDDTISPRAGNDKIQGGQGRDIFSFGSNDDLNQIEDFELDLDQLKFNARDISELEIRQYRNDTRISYQGTVVQLWRVDAQTLKESSFIFNTEQNSPENLAIDFPTDAGVVRVDDFGAIPDDGIDDTAAIQAAFDSFSGGQKILYFGQGTYHISSTLRPNEDQGLVRFTIVQGAGKALTKIKLIENSGLNGALLDFRSFDEASQVANGAINFGVYFRNSVRDLTLIVGAQNDDATGLIYAANNQGTVSDVAIISEDGNARIGLDLGSIIDNGPLLVKNVEIEGFDIGIRSSFLAASMTFDGITLSEQNEVSWLSNQAQNTFANNVHFENTPLAFNGPRSSDVGLVLTNSRIEAAQNAGANAIENDRSAYLHNVVVQGFDRAFSATNNFFDRNRLVDVSSDGVINEFWQLGSGNLLRGGPFTLFDDAAQTMLQLPQAALTPPVLERNLSQWVSALDFGGEVGIREGTFNAPVAEDDDTAAIQAAIDAAAAKNASTVYLANGTWVLLGDVTIHGSVERLLGTEAQILGGGNIIVAEGSSASVTIERLQNSFSPAAETKFKIIHQSARPLFVNNLAGFYYEPIEGVSGDVYITDVVAGALRITENQHVWASQLNIEDTAARNTDYEAHIVNDGGTLKVLGYKTEGDGTHVLTRNGGKTEILGHFHQSSSLTVPQYMTTDADFSVVVSRSVAAGGLVGTVMETRDGLSRTGNMGIADGYSAIRPNTVAGDVIVLDTQDAVFSGDVNTIAGFPGGFVGKNYVFMRPNSGATARFEKDLAVAGEYEIFGRWHADFGGQPDSGHATNAKLMIDTASGEQIIFLNQKKDFGDWTSLGSFDLSHGKFRALFDTEGANGNVIVDAIRLERIEQ